MAEIVLLTRQSQQPQTVQGVQQQNVLQQSRHSSTINQYNFPLLVRPPNQVFNPMKSISHSIQKQFENLPFMKTLECLLSCIHWQTNDDYFKITGVFHLSDSMINSIVKSWNFEKQEYKIQIVLRLVQVSLSEKTHQLSNNINVSINNNLCSVPTSDYTKKNFPWHCYDVPIDITPLSILSKSFQNKLNLTCSEDQYEYMAGVFVVQKLTLNDLLEPLKKRPGRASYKTKEIINNCWKSDIDMGIDSMFVSLKDPLTQQRMKLPARGAECIHMQCFDALHFLQMNEQKQTWTCPICKNKVKFEDIEIDDFFLNIIQSPNLGKDCVDVFLFKDGSWTERKNNEFSNNCQFVKDVEVITLSVTDDGDANSNDDLHNNENKKIIPKPKRLKCNPPIVEESVMISQHIVETANLSNCTNNNPIDLSRTNNSTLSASACSNYTYLPNNTTTRANTKSNEYQEKYQSRPVLCVITLD